MLFFWQKLVWIENNPIFCNKTGQLDIEENTYLAFCFFDCCRKCNLQYHNCALNPANNHSHCLRQAYGCASKCLTESSMSISIEGWWYFKEAFWRTVCWSMDVVDYCKIINGPKTVFLRIKTEKCKRPRTRCWWPPFRKNSFTPYSLSVTVPALNAYKKQIFCTVRCNRSMFMTATSQFFHEASTWRIKVVVNEMWSS